MRFLVECDFEEFKGYLRRIGFYKDEDDLKNLEALVSTKLLNLIVWKENSEIIGHAIWHESNTGEHRKGVPRDKEDSQILERLT